MGRLVRIPRPASQPREGAGVGVGTAGDPAASTAIEQDDYLLRLAKYVPAEVLAFSILINAILDQALRNGGPAAMMAGVPVTTIAVAALILGTIMSPFYVWYVHQKGDAWVTNAWVSFFAFPFWSYALGAVAFADYRDGNLAAILLASFTAMSGLIKPLPFEPAGAEEGKETATREAAPRGARSAVTAARRLVDVSAIPMPGPGP
jgi:hypothetical protein